MYLCRVGEKSVDKYYDKINKKCFGDKKESLDTRTPPLGFGRGYRSPPPELRAATSLLLLLSHEVPATDATPSARALSNTIEARRESVVLFTGRGRRRTRVCVYDCTSATKYKYK